MSAEIEIKYHVRIIGGKHLCNRNANLIRLEKTKLGCHVHGCPGILDPKNYREVYRIEKDFWDEFKNGKSTGRKKKGYSFVEVNHRFGGPGGIQPSVRQLVLAAMYGIFGSNDHKIVFEGSEE